MQHLPDYKGAYLWAYDRIRVRVSDYIYRMLSFNPPFIFRRISMQPDGARFDIAPLYEIEYPYRPGTVIVLRLWKHLGIQLGLLEMHPSLDDDDIDDRLLKAIRSTAGTVDFQKAMGKEWAQWARTMIGTHALNLDDEAQLTEMLGLWEGDL